MGVRRAAPYVVNGVGGGRWGCGVRVTETTPVFTRKLPYGIDCSNGVLVLGGECHSSGRCEFRMRA